MASGGVVESAGMAEEIAMGFRVLKIDAGRLISDRCCVYLESTTVV
jgi:hypothetical protein